MPGTGATFWIPGGAVLAAFGLCLLLHAGAGIRTVMHWVGWGSCSVGGVLMAGAVLNPTGSFWSLLLFCGLSAAALLCATISAVRQPPIVAGDTTTDRKSWIGDKVWFLASSAAIAAMLVWQGNIWSGGALLPASAGLTAACAWFSRQEIVERNSFRSFEFDSGERVSHSGLRHPALASLMWGALMWALVTALRHGQTALAGAASPDSARLNNIVAVACGLLALGALQIVTREQPRRRWSGFGSLLLGTLLVCSAGSDRGQSEALCLAALACIAVNAVVLLSAAHHRSAEPAVAPASARGDA